MVEKDINLLGRDVTLRKKDGSAIRGLCVNQFNDSYVIDPSNGSTTKRVTVLKINVDEILFDEFKPLTLKQTLSVKDEKNG